MVAVPEVVRNKALAADASSWLDALPTLIADLEQDWAVSVGRVYQDATEAFVAEATRADRTEVVVKILVFGRIRPTFSMFRDSW